MKKDEGKPELSLIYESFVNAVAKVRTFGLIKYPGKEDWRTTETKKHYDALMRHIFAATDWFNSGHGFGRDEENDQQSGLDHLAHAACNIMFLIEEKETGKEEHSRFEVGQGLRKRTNKEIIYGKEKGMEEKGMEEKEDE